MQGVPAGRQAHTRIALALSSISRNIPVIHRDGVYPMTVFLIGASVSGVMLGATNRIIFLLPAALMALVVASVLIVRSDIDICLTALTATLFCGGYLLGVVMANTRPRLFTRQ